MTKSFYQINSQAERTQGDEPKTLLHRISVSPGIGETVSVDTSVTRWGNRVFSKSSLFERVELLLMRDAASLTPAQVLGAWQDSVWISLLGRRTPLVVSYPPWQDLNRRAGWAWCPPLLPAQSAPSDSGSPCKQDKNSLDKFNSIKTINNQWSCCV